MKITLEQIHIEKGLTSYRKGEKPSESCPIYYALRKKFPLLDIAVGYSTARIGSKWFNLSSEATEVTFAMVGNQEKITPREFSIELDTTSEV